MSMIDDAADETKNARKEAQRREQAQHGKGEPGNGADGAGSEETGSGDDRDTSGDVPVANLE